MMVCLYFTTSFKDMLIIPSNYVNGVAIYSNCNSVDKGVDSNGVPFPSTHTQLEHMCGSFKKKQKQKMNNSVINLSLDSLPPPPFFFFFLLCLFCSKG